MEVHLHDRTGRLEDTRQGSGSHAEESREVSVGDTTVEERVDGHGDDKQHPLLHESAAHDLELCLPGVFGSQDDGHAVRSDDLVRRGDEPRDGEAKAFDAKEDEVRVGSDGAGPRVRDAARSALGSHSSG